MNIALCFCVRNCEHYLPFIFENIELIKSLNFTVFSVFVYDNCNDNSKYILDEYESKNNDKVIVRNIINESQNRTERIANARNTCLEIVYTELNNILFHIMIDCDDVCASKWDIDVINKYLNNFDNDDWDCISFNRNDYYDIWALFFDDFRHHCWGFGNVSSTAGRIMREVIVDKIKNCETNSLEVISAFNGFCIYKTDKFEGFRYDGLYCNIKELITEEERINTIQEFKKYNLDVKIVEITQCCEHLFYHLSAFRKGRKIKISKFKVINV